MLQWMNALSLASILQLEQSASNPNATASPVTPSTSPSKTPVSSPQYRHAPQAPQSHSQPSSSAVTPTTPSTGRSRLHQHHHPTAVHQMHSASGDAYMYHAKAGQQGRTHPDGPLSGSAA